MTTSKITPVQRFASEFNVSVDDVLTLCRLARRAKHAEEQAISYDRPGLPEASDKASAAFERKAQSLGFTVQWPGLWPTLDRGDRQFIELPID